jgi:hypothetical protein
MLRVCHLGYIWLDVHEGMEEGDHSFYSVCMRDT